LTRQRVSHSSGASRSWPRSHRHARSQRPQRGLDKKFGSPTVTKDGVTVAKEIELEDAYENMGAQMVREVASKTSDAPATAPPPRPCSPKRSSRRPEERHRRRNPIGIQRGIQKAVEAAVEHLAKIAKKVKDKERSSRSPPSPPTGTANHRRIIADAMDKVGKDGTITVEEAKSIEPTLDVVEGMQFDKGYLSPYFVTNAESRWKPSSKTLTSSITKRRSAAQGLLPILEKVQSRQAALIIAEDVEGEALATLVVNKLRGSSTFAP
jgi:chaperonin GroEL